MTGFTNHEMLGKNARVHMNGRVYDPNLGRFLSVDPVFEFPTNTQSLNPYSYVLNNPLSMTDPTGYVSTCGTGKTSCPDDMKPGDTAEKTFTPTGSHIAIHITATVQANGDVAISSNNTQVAQSISSAAANMFGGGNGAQNSSQGPGTALGLSTSGNQGANMAPAFNATVTSSNRSTTGNTVTATNEAEEIKLLHKTWSDLPSGVKFWERKDSAQDLAQYAKDKIDIRQGFAKGQSAADCAKGCEPGYTQGNSIVLYAGAALAAGYTSEGGVHGTMFIVGHEFRHTTLANKQIFSDYLRQNPDVSMHWIGSQENGTKAQHDALPWENDANEYGRAMAGAYDLLHPQ